MATFGPRFGEDDLGTLSLEERGPGLVEVLFQPSATRLRIAGREGDPTTRVLLLRFDAANTATTLFPINTMPTSERFLEPKHAPILSIELVEERGFFNEYDVPKTLEDVEAFLAEGMPSGFTKDPNYGLGLDRNLLFVVHALAKVDGIQKLRLSNERTLDVAVADNGAIYEMGYTLFDALRRNANRFDDRARASSRKKKHQAAYTNLLTNLDREKFPLKLFERAPDDLAEVIGETIVDARLSEKDRAAVVGLAGATVRKSIKTHRAGLVKLHDEIELASLDELIVHMETQFAAKATELQWQKLFEANPFILDMAFNVPVLLLQGQAHVGGKILDGSGEKIADFLFTNQLTDSIAILEIKTPGMELVSRKQYRGGVLAPSPELVGAVVQTLDQIDKLRSDIYRIKALNPQHQLEAHGIKGVLLAGMIPHTERKRSFELYRNSMSGLSVITFDELLAKLRSLRELLSAKPT
ncbi:Shedu immune nuclease family protein [Manganibacter manganicus]|uniref:Shedu protein SduA C-terminal domain-containing protein n=1 Tax=Manganibacter manganicus TaxID=1873176 RepID=A0A1V8RWR6_9HYPH|nr:Shedu immune nuclease family protein [Pseudaminobacter manganicus]OQM77628.1 hypothetical protein BFN67_01995 [Pseudaminobacter manganicus]